jgi:hypothetical protein
MNLNKITNKLKDVIEFNDWIINKASGSWSWFCNASQISLHYATMIEDYKNLAYYYFGIGPDSKSQNKIIRILKKRRVGMTSFNCYLVSYLAAKNPNMQILYIVPNMPFEDRVMSFVRSLGGHIESKYDSIRSFISYKNGSRITFKVNSILKETYCERSLDLVIVDDCELTQEQKSALYPCVNGPDSKIIYISSFESSSDFFEFTKGINPTKINKGIYVS